METIPFKKSDLKILLLHNQYNDMQKLENIGHELGLNITCILNDKKSTIKKKITTELDNYDIVIINNSTNINFINEYLEKNKNSLKLFLRYKYQDYYSFYRTSYGSNIILERFYSNMPTDIISFNILNSNDKISNIFKAIITSSLNIYNDNFRKIEDLNFKSYQEYDEAFKLFEKKELLEEESYLKLHKEFIEMSNLILLYLNYKKQGYIKSELEDLNISYDENGNINIKNTYQNNIYGILILDKLYQEFNVREFSLQMYTEDNKLLFDKRLAIYTDAYKLTTKTPPKPNIEEQLIIKDIISKVNNILTPILEEAVVHKSKIEKENNEKLKRKK